MKNSYHVQNSVSKRHVREMINKEFLESIKEFWGKVNVVTMPSTEGYHEISLLKKIRARFPSLKKNIFWELCDYKRSKVSNARTKICEHFIFTTRKNESKNFQRLIDHRHFAQDILSTRAGNVLDNVYHDFSDNKPVLAWFDLCSGPTPKNIESFIENCPVTNGSKIFITFLTDGIREGSWANGLNKQANSKEIHQYLLDRLTERWGSFGKFTPINNFPFEYINEYPGQNKWVSRKAAVFGFEYSDCPIEEEILTKNKKSLQSNSTMSKENNKTVERYAELSQRFTNKQIAVFWKMSLQQVAGYAASAKRKGLV